MNRKWHIVAYDVRDDKRLRRAARLLEGYGQRVQYSVFRCRLSSSELQRLRWEMAQVIEAEDALLIAPLCEHCSAGITGLHLRQDWNQDNPSFAVV